MNDHFLTSKQAAQLLGVAPQTIHKWAHEGKLKGVQDSDNSDWKFSKESLSNLVKAFSEEVISETHQQSISYEKHFQATFEQPVFGMAHVGLNGRYMLVNQKFAEMTGYTRPEMLTKTYHEISYYKDLENEKKPSKLLLQSKINSFSREKRYIKKNGSFLWVNLTVTLVKNEQGQPLYYVNVIEDITEKILARQSLAQIQKKG